MFDNVSGSWARVRRAAMAVALRADDLACDLESGAFDEAELKVREFDASLERLLEAEAGAARPVAA